MNKRFEIVLVPSLDGHSAIHLWVKFTEAMFRDFRIEMNKATVLTFVDENGAFHRFDLNCFASVHVYPCKEQAGE